MPDSATATTSAGMRAASAAARSWSTAKVRRSRWLTPTRRAPAARARSSSSSSCTSTRAARPRCVGAGLEAGQLVVVECGGDQQHGVGPHEAGVDHVDLRHGEVLAQHREPAASWAAVRRSSTEPPKNSRSVRTERHDAPPGGVLLGHQVGLEVGVEVALGGRAALDLGDAARPAPRPRSAAGEVARRRQDRPAGLRRLRHQLVGVPAVVTSAGPVRGEDVRQVGGHDDPA